MPDLSSRSAQTLLEVVGLTKHYPGRGDGLTACKDVSFQVRQGEALAVVGESGAGKSTVIRLIAGLEQPTSGEIRLGGAPQSPARQGRSVRLARAAAVQIVHQDPYSALDPRQTIGDGIIELLKIHRHRLGEGARSLDARRGRAERLLETVGLPDMSAARPATLSGGQRQRAAIARALAVEPQILLLDEAVAALDVSVQAQILNLLADLRDNSGTTLVFVTHDLAVVRQLCSEAVVMRAGQVIEHGPVSRLLTTPEHPYTQALLDAVPREGWRPTRTTTAKTVTSTA